MIANTPKPPYYAVIFSSMRTEVVESYGLVAEKMMELAAEQEGFLGVESLRNDYGITVSYWKDLESIKKWRDSHQHKIAKENGISKWYENYKVRIAKVEIDYDFEHDIDKLT